MPFRYRLQKVLDFRINQKEEQRIKVQKAQQAVYKAEDDIKKNQQDIVDTKEGMRRCDPMMYELMIIIFNISGKKQNNSKQYGRNFKKS